MYATSLSLRKSNEIGDICQISVRTTHDKIETIHCLSSKEAIEKYFELIGEEIPVAADNSELTDANAKIEELKTANNDTMNALSAANKNTEDVQVELDKVKAELKTTKTALTKSENKVKTLEEAAKTES